jgi:hypothetical protein
MIRHLYGSNAMKTHTFAVLAVFSAMLFVLLLTCAKKSPTAPEEKDFTGSISGYVFSRLTGSPAPGVLVSINADSAQAGVTDPMGRFMIGVVKAGTHELHFTHADLEDTNNIVVTVEKGEDVALDDTVRLTYRYYILSGRILYGSSPIPGAGVAVGNTPLSSIVGTDGKFTLDRVPKTLPIELICAKSKVGFATQMVSAPVANGTTKVGDIKLTEEGATVCGTVYDTAGKPMGNVIVAAVGGGLVDTTDSLGRYRLENVPSNTEVRIFVPGQDGLSGAVTGLRVVEGATLQGVNILLRPEADISAGNGMALTVNDLLVIDTAQSARLTVYPTTNDTTVITTFKWTLLGKTEVTITTDVAILNLSLDSLVRIAAEGPDGMVIKVTVVAVNSRGDESQPQSFEITISSARPVVTAAGSESSTGTRKDSVTIEAGSWAWLFGSAYAPFGGIDTLWWDFGDGTPVWKRTDTIQPISHKYSKEGNFSAVFSVIDRSGERVADTVIIKAIASSIPKPVLVSPADRDTNRTLVDSVTLVWNKVSGSSITYTVYCDSLNNPPVSTVAQGLADTSLRMRIDSGRTIWWTVEAMKSGKSGPTADGRMFTGRGAKKPDTAKGLVAYYPFNGNAKDESGNGNDGTVNGAILTTDRFGKGQASVSLNGTDNWIQIPSKSTGPSGTSDYTLSIWINTSDSLGYIVDERDAVQPMERGFCLSTYTDGNIYFDVQDGGVNSGRALLKTSFVNTNWHHIVGIRQGSKSRIYSDGILMNEGTSNTGSAINIGTPNAISIGRRFIFASGTTGYGYYKGLLDDIRIYNRALSPAEIDSLYHEGGWTGNTTNNPPVFSTTPAQMTDSAKVGTQYKDTVIATDADNDTVRYSFIDCVSGMTLGSTSGIITWTPTKGDTGNKIISILADDGKSGLDTLIWTISGMTPSAPKLIWILLLFQVVCFHPHLIRTVLPIQGSSQMP